MPTISAYEEIQTIYRLRGSPHIISANTLGGGDSGSEADLSPAMIPKIIHQTYKTANVPQQVRPYMLVGPLFLPCHVTPSITRLSLQQSSCCSALTL